MTTLASAVSIGDNQLLIDAPMSAGQIPGWVKIDSELLNVGGQHFRTGTTLVLTDPATATHSQGATVTYAGRPYNAAFLAATAGEGGAGAITVTDGVTTVPDVTTLHALAVVEASPGEAEITTFPDGWFFDTGVSGFLTNPGAGVLVGDLTEDGPYVKIEADRIKVSGNDLTVEDGTDGMPILWADTVEGVAAFENVGGDFRFRVLRSGAVLLPGLPTADPVVADQLWIDTAAGRVLKVSAG